MNNQENIQRVSKTPKDQIADDIKVTIYSEPITEEVHKFCTPLTMVAPDPRQKMPTADIKDHTNLSFE